MYEEKNITGSKERLWNLVVMFLNSDHNKLMLRIKGTDVEKTKIELERKFYLLDIPLIVYIDGTSITLTKEGR